MTTFTNGQLNIGLQQAGTPEAYHTTRRDAADATYFARLLKFSSREIESGEWTAFGGRMTGLFNRPGGLAQIAGHTFIDDENPVRRHVMVLTQPPRPSVLWEGYSDPDTGAFELPRTLPPGNYMVIDSMPDNSQQAMIYDWIVVP